MPVIASYKSYHIGSDAALSHRQMDQMVACFQIPAQGGRAGLGGRNPVLRAHIDGIGRVVVKTYTRGGLIRRFNEKTYFRIKTIRSRAEYELLRWIKTLGLGVPNPVAFAYQGGLFYHAWLLTKEIPKACTLAELSLRRPDRVHAVLPKVNREVLSLIRHGVYHPDLHPGNVLVDTANRVYLIDFDRAKTRRRNPSLLGKSYARRWQRAVLKHRLPQALNRMMEPEPDHSCPDSP
jgi:serine/threonine protein kinase